MKKSKMLLVALLVFLLGIITVQAEEKQELVNAMGIDVSTSEEGVTFVGLDMVLTLQDGYVLNEDWEYFVKFVSEGDSKPTDIPNNSNELLDFDSDIMDVYTIAKWKLISSGEVLISGDWYMLKGYDYAYFLACDRNECIISDEAVKVERPELPPYGQRYDIMFFGEDQSNDEPFMSVWVRYPNDGSNGSHRLNVKIGIITDENLLYSLYKNESGALSNLIGYAQRNEGTVFSANDLEVGHMEVDNLVLQDGAIYYIYTTYENSDGMYRDLSDVTFAQADHGVLNNDIKWNFSDSEITPPGSGDGEGNVQSPDTGDLDMIVLTGAMILLAGASIVAYRKIKAN